MGVSQPKDGHSRNSRDSLLCRRYLGIMENEMQPTI